MGEGEHHCSDGQAKIATEKVRDKHDWVIVQEKLDGSNVGVARIDGRIVPLTRAGYVANTSPFKMHHVFYQWVISQQDRFMDVLFDGERLCGEWLLIAHGTRYELKHEPFVVFDIMEGMKRKPYEEFDERLRDKFILPHVLSQGWPRSIGWAMDMLNHKGFHGALDDVEGAVWRVQRRGQVDFLCKYVRPDKEDGRFLKDADEGRPFYNYPIEKLGLGE